MNKLQTKLLQALYEDIHENNIDSMDGVIDTTLFIDLENMLGSFIHQYGEIG